MADLIVRGKRAAERGVVSTLVDAADLPELEKHRWYLSPAGYVYTRTRNAAGSYVNVMLHHMILAPKGGHYADHIDGDRLDNRRSNLRPATVAQNNRNRGAHRTNTSGYKGVTHCGRRGRGVWRAQITGESSYIHLGTFPHPVLAAIAYNAAARALHGEFARLNVITPEALASLASLGQPQAELAADHAPELSADDLAALEGMVTDEWTPPAPEAPRYAAD